MSSNRLSRDQKRKKKVTQRQKSNSPAVVPYEGSKYREGQFAEILYRAEVGIREADEMSDNRMTDRDVRQSLEDFILHLRGESAPSRTQDMLAWRIQENWKETVAEQIPRPSNSDLSGVLRTIMGSVDVRTRMTPGGRGYLSFLIGFLGKMGVHVQRVSPDSLVTPLIEDFSDNEDE